MSVDSQMIVRNSEDGVYNFSLGEPYFLQQAFAETFNFSSASSNKDFPYPSYGGQSSLIEELKHLHPGKHIVVANGGKQSLLAAMYAFKQSTENDDLTVHHTAPFWPSYPGLSYSSGLNFSTTDLGPHSLSVITAPNNPSGSVKFNKDKTYDVADMAYAHKIYGYEETPKNLVAVYSASKVYGLSGYRIGWLVTEDEKLAESARHYVEITTSGVSSLSQAAMTNVLQIFRHNEGLVNKFYELGEKYLKINADIFNSTIAQFCDQVYGVPTYGAGGGGMFAWAHVSLYEKFAAAVKEAKILLVSGESCGMTEKGWVRISMGQTNDITKAGLTALRIALLK